VASKDAHLIAVLLGDVKTINQGLQKLEGQIRDIRGDFEHYKEESARGVKKFNATKDMAEKEVYIGDKIAKRIGLNSLSL
jgi:hypothetical protein